MVLFIFFYRLFMFNIPLLLLIEGWKIRMLKNLRRIPLVASLFVMALMTHSGASAGETFRLNKYRQIEMSVKALGGAYKVFDPKRADFLTKPNPTDDEI